MTFWQSVGKQNLLFSVTQLSPTLYDLMDSSMPGLAHISQSLPSSCPLYWWSHPAISSSDALFSFCPQAFPEAGTFPMMQLFASVDQNKSFSFSISPSNEYSGLISFKIDWFDLLAVQGTLRNLLQHHSSKASILWHSAFFMVSHPCMTTRKTIALAIRTFVNKVSAF